MEKGQLGMSIEDLFDTTATIERATETQKPDASLAEEWNPLIEDIPGSLQALSASERAAYKRLEVLASYVFFCLPQQIEVTQKDRLVHSSGKVFDIVYVDNWHQVQHHWKLVLEESK